MSLENKSVPDFSDFYIIGSEFGAKARGIIDTLQNRTKKYVGITK
jgi:hypothetical protein